MYRFRILLILTAAWLTLVFNLERPEIFGIGTINLASMVYAIAAGIMVIMVLMPELGKRPVYHIFLPILAIYGIGKLTIDNRPLTDSMVVYISITEIVVLLITLWIARIVSLAVSDFENTVESAVVGDNTSRVLTASDGKNVIDRELLRARRYDRPIALLHLQIKALDKIAQAPSRYLDTKKAFEHRYLQARVTQLIDTLLHDSDIMTWNNGCLVICMPETVSDDAIKMAKNIHVVLKIEMTLGIACFPDDALIYSDLITAAKNNPWYPGSENVVPMRQREAVYAQEKDSLQQASSV
ncbi:MAG TPA: hypothetical protein VJZ27_18715 [Aggregatilineales bacterium]|nr:hypothetical protein [Aggregatilineales bacterium]